MITLSLALTLTLSHTSAQADGACWEQGAEARFAGDFVRAEAILETCLEANPNDADALVQLGLARLARGDQAGADAALSRALDIAPAYDDARIGRARIAYFNQDFTRALDLLEPVGADRPEAATLRASILEARRAETTQPAHPWRIDLTASRSDLTQNLPDWSLVGLAVGKRITARDALTGSLAWAERFDVEDVYAELRYDRRLGARSSGYVAVGGSPDAVFSPERILRAGGEAGLGANGLSATLDTSAAYYVSGDVYTVIPGLRKSFAGDAARVGARVIFLRDETGETRTGWSVSGELDAGARTRLLAGYTDAPETSEGVTLDVRALAVGARFELDARTGLTTQVIREERSAYNRTEVLVSINRRF